MVKIIDPQKDKLKLVECLNSNIHKVLIPFWHGHGDVVQFISVFKRIQNLYPNIKFDIGLCKGLDQEKIIPDAVLLEGNWREKCVEWDYDLVFCCNFPLEDIKNPNVTKSEVCCREELGIEPVSSHFHLKSKPLVALHFQQTSIPFMSNAEEPVAKLIWEDVISMNCVPIECHMLHIFHNGSNSLYHFVDTHLRNCAAKTDTLMSVIGSVFAFIGVVSGPFHLALSIKPWQKVMLLERELPAGCFTKLPIATANLKNYKHEVKDWLSYLLEKEKAH